MTNYLSWDVVDRVSDLATIGTAAASIIIAVLLANRDGGRRRMIEKYLKQVAETKGETEQGLRSAFHLSRHLGIPVADVSRLAFSSGKIVRRIRQRDAEEPRLLFGYKKLSR